MVGSPVLIVENDDDLCDLLLEIVQEEGFRVLAVASAKEALTLMERLEPCLLLVDLGHPTSDRQHARDLMQFAEERGLAIIAISTQPNVEVPAGAVVVQKPVQVIELITALARHCSRQGRDESHPG